MNENILTGPVSVSKMFESKEDVKNFFEFLCDYIIKTCKKINEDKEENKISLYPIVYADKHETLSISFNFFVGCIAKFYDPGNQDTEDKINYYMKLTSSKSLDDKDHGKLLVRTRSLIMVHILQDYYGILHSNNSRINVSSLKGMFTPKISYYIPIIYEDMSKKATEFSMVQLKPDKLLKLGIDYNLIERVKEYGLELMLKDVAFNKSNTLKYWENSKQKQKVYEV